MPNLLEADIADSNSSNIFTSIDDFKERPITMSITQSNSFGSNQLPNMNMDGPELTISLSASSESLGFDENCVDLNLKNSFGVEADERKMGGFVETKSDANTTSSIGSNSNTIGEDSIASTRTNESKQGQGGHPTGKSGTGLKPGYGGPGPHPHPQGPPPPHGYLPYNNVSGGPTPPYHPQYQRPYYPNSGGPSQYNGGPQQYEHRFPPNGPPGPYNPNGPHPSYHGGMQYQQSSYHGFPPHSGYPPHGYRHGPPPPPPQHMSSNNSTASNPAAPSYIPNSNSSNMSVSSHGSTRKRTIDGIMEDDSRNTFSKHRCSSNSSTCSTATTGNNTSSETINQIICESPLKKERTVSPKCSKDRGESGESGTGPTALSFVGLNMGKGEKAGGSVTKDKRPLDTSRTPVSKNTTSQKTAQKMEHEDQKDEQDRSTFTFERDCDTKNKRFSPEEHSLNRQLREQSFTPIHPNDLKRQSSISPSFNEQLEIAPQLSWSISGEAPALGDLADWPKGDGDERNASPMSFAGNISPMMFNISPSEAKGGQNNSASKANKTEDIMRMNVLSPSVDDEKNVEEKTTPLPFSSSKPIVNRRPHSPQSMEKLPYQRPAEHRYHERMPFPALSPKGAMPMTSPRPFNPPTPHSQGPKLLRPNFDRREDAFHRSRHPGSRDGPPTPNYQSPRGMYPAHMNGQDRIRNLRGRVPGALPPPLHLPPHLPSHAHFLTSPIGTTPRGMMLSSPHHRIGGHPFPHSPHLSASKRKCVPLKPPIPCKFQGDMEKMKNSTVPEFTSLVNFPAHMSQKQASMIPEGMRCCVMCGHACPSTASNKNKKGAKKATDGEGGRMGNSYAIIPTQNKGLCTQCDVNVWVVTANNLEIKWCKGCKNFRPWAAFGEKGLATKCVRCRERQREKYAKQKEEKDKQKSLKAKSLGK